MSPRPRVDHPARLRRMIGMLPWLIAEGETTVPDIAARFGIPEKQVYADLTVLSMTALGPDDSDMLALSVDEDGSVVVWEQSLFTKPLRLTDSEAFAVLASAAALLTMPDVEVAPALASAVEKLRVALGGDYALSVQLPVPRFLTVVQDAASRHERLDVTYYSLHRNEVTRRVLDAFVVFSDEGQWYVIARDSLSGDARRRFRVDRIIDASATGDAFAPEQVEVPQSSFVAVPETRDVVLDVPASARWVVETYDAVDVEEHGLAAEGGRLRVVLRVTGEVWLAQLLLRIGPDAHVVDPPELRAAGRELASRLLAMYDEGLASAKGHP